MTAKKVHGADHRIEKERERKIEKKDRKESSMVHRTGYMGRERRKR